MDKSILDKDGKFVWNEVSSSESDEEIAIGEVDPQNEDEIEWSEKSEDI